MGSLKRRIIEDMEPREEPPIEMKDYTLTCGEVIKNLLMLSDAYQRLAAGQDQSGFSINVTDAAANLKAAVHFIGSFGQQIPLWVSVEERLPEHLEPVIGWHPASQRAFAEVCWNATDRQWADVDSGLHCGAVTHWMPLPEPPEQK